MVAPSGGRRRRQGPCPRGLAPYENRSLAVVVSNERRGATKGVVSVQVTEKKSSQMVGGRHLARNYAALAVTSGREAGT